MSVFENDDYRVYLKDYLRSLPKEGHGQARKIAAHLGVSSTYVSQVLSGQKSLNLEQAELLTEFLGLRGLEADCFLFLVERDRAGTTRLQKYWSEKIEKLRDQSKQLANRVEAQRVLTDEDKAVFYSNALFSAIHLFTSTGKSGRTFEEIIRRFELTRAKAAQIIEFLKSRDLVLENDGLLSMGGQSTHVGADSPHLLKHHSNWRLRAIGASESLTAQELMYTTNVSLSKKDFEILREEMVVFIKDFLKTVHASPAEEVACFNLDFFWVRK